MLTIVWPRDEAACPWHCHSGGSWYFPDPCRIPERVCLCPCRIHQVYGISTCRYSAYMWRFAPYLCLHVILTAARANATVERYQLASTFWGSALDCDPRKPGFVWFEWSGEQKFVCYSVLLMHTAPHHPDGWPHEHSLLEQAGSARSYQGCEAVTRQVNVDV